MPDHPLTCPICSYDLSGHAATDADELSQILCPKCGELISIDSISTTPNPKHPILASIIALILIAVLSVGCCFGLWQAFFYWAISSK